jgi:MFS family permease
VIGAGGLAPTETASAAAVFRNGSFLRLWLAQAATQIGGNMVLFGLLVIVRGATGSNTAVAILILSFLVPAVLFSAVAGVYVDRIDRRLILIATNLIRGVMYIALFFVGDNFALILLLNTAISVVNVFFSPAEASMIPVVVPRAQLIAANGIFILTLNAAFALGFALLGPLVVNIASAEVVILVVAALFFLATILCIMLPSSPPTAVAAAEGGEGPLGSVREAEQAVESTVAQLREGLGFIRGHREISWSLLYLGIAASIVGVLGVLGPDFAETTLGLQAKDFAVIVLPLGFGIVLGILLLNAYGKYLPRRRVIEGGLIGLGAMLLLLSIAGQLSQFLQAAEQASDLVDLSAVTSLLGIVVVIAFFAGIAYGFVAIPSQTQLQEDLPVDVRGRVFGVLNMLVSVSSFLPIILVGPISDLIGTTAVIIVVALGIVAAGIGSVVRRGPLLPLESQTVADPHAVDPIAAALGADRPRWSEMERRPDPSGRDAADFGTESPSAFGGDAPDRD